jgi:hypothetical protein
MDGIQQTSGFPVPQLRDKARTALGFDPLW